MPTSRPRHTLTESDDLSRALEDAAKRWPEDRDARGRLLVRLVHEGHRAIREENAQRAAARREALRSTSGALTGAYEPGYLERLRHEWPD
jgi:hypothetical protein